MLLGAVVEVFEDFRYIDQVEDGDTAVAGLRGAGRRPRAWTASTSCVSTRRRIAEMMVMVRPMSGMHALAEAMGARLAATDSG